MDAPTKKRQADEKQKIKCQLPPCKYGKECYRKQPEHRKQFSHPCEYGDKCYRHNLEHFVDHNHPWDFDSDEDNTTTPKKIVKTNALKSSGSDEENDNKNDDNDSDYSSPKASSKKKKSSSGGGKPLEGKIFAISGTLSMLRRDIVGKIQEAGGHWKDGVSGGTDFLISTPNEVMTATAKVHKARVLDVPIVNEEFLWDSIKKGAIVDHKKYLITVDTEDE